MPANPIPQKLRVLVVENDLDTARLLTTLLETWGHQTTVAVSGEIALHVAERQPFDVILLDINMPGVDGWQVAKQLREKYHWQRPLLVAVTAHNTAEDVEQSRAVGIDLHLVKPIAVNELDQLLQTFKRVVQFPGNEERPVPVAVQPEAQR